ncbi:hypothetical protein QBC35DRAFT_195252 [Podospora australis]|uniref:CSN8/PSMD8/EIF3K domain-containing protein n=1 Tax=Podospora australis TaxID=1536484 RepID=A0AAN6WVJ1_9PEZI|nr:hypothetical protein QBC35DRAFT_195252 [Podospora australis]
MQRKAGRTPSGQGSSSGYGHGNHHNNNHHHHGLSRLKPVEIDPLSEYGLPSKGEKRLLSPKVQESYYSKIAERYLAFCTDAGDRDSLQQQFALLSLSSSSQVPSPAPSQYGTEPPSPSTSLPTPSSEVFPTPTTLPATPTTRSESELSLILAALRKLREALVASKRRDAFAAQVYLFAIRAGILASSYESYYPALLYLLGGIHPSHNLTSVELSEVVSYLILDAACRRGDLASAYALRNQYKLRDAKIDGVLKALAGDNWCLWRRLKRGVDGYRARIMDWAEKEVKGITLRAMGRAYLSVPLAFLEAQTGETWETLREKHGVGWELGEGGRVVIRRVQARG